jgi:hypothetical protein
MKKLLKILFLLLLPFYSAFGLTQIGVSIHDTTMVAGDTVFIPVYIDSSLTGKNVSSYKMEISFYKYSLIIDSAYSDGTMTSGWGAVTYNTNVDGKISIVAAGATDLEGTGILFYLRAIGIRHGGSNINFTGSNCYFNEGSPDIVLDNGYVVVNAKSYITVSPNSEILTVGDTKQFSVSHGTAPYEWSLSNPSVASINSDGILTALSKGTTKVIAKDASNIIDSTNEMVEVRNFKLSLRDTSHYQGQFVDIPIYTTDLTGLNYTAGEFSISLNKNILTPTEIITTGTLLSEYSLPNFSFKNGKVKIAFAGSTPLTGAGVLLILRCHISSVNIGSTGLIFSEILFNETDLGNGERANFTILRLATLNVTPQTGTLLAGETLQFNASDGTTPYTWSVSNTALASIDAATGILTALKGGIVTVAATDIYGGVGSSQNINLFDTEVSIHDTTTEAGTTIDIPIYMGTLASSYSILSMQTEILFDSSKIKFDRVVTDETLTEGWNFSTNNMGNKVVIAGASTSGFNSAGKIVKLRFNVLSNLAVGNYSNINFNNFLFNEGSPNALLTNGKLTIKMGSLPISPSGLVALSVADTKISLTWVDNSNNESGFKIERKISSTGTWAEIVTIPQNVITYIDSNLALGINYYYRVRAYNNSGNSDYSNEANASTASGKPDAPTNLRVELDEVDSCSTIAIGWQDNSDNELGFYLNRKQAMHDWNEIASPIFDATSYVDTELLDGTKYFYQIFAWNNNGNSEFSNIDSVITQMCPPTDLEAVQLENDNVGLTWVDNSQSELGYIIEREDGVSNAVSFIAIDTVGANVATFEDEHAIIGETHIYRVKGYNLFVESKYSNDAYITLTGINALNEIPDKFELFQNYPNPFNPTTMIKFSTPEESKAYIVIYNLLGEKVATLINKQVSAGYYEINWNASTNPSGVYLVSIRL